MKNLQIPSNLLNKKRNNQLMANLQISLLAALSIMLKSCGASSSTGKVSGSFNAKAAEKVNLKAGGVKTPEAKDTKAKEVKPAVAVFKKAGVNNAAVAKKQVEASSLVANPFVAKDAKASEVKTPVAQSKAGSSSVDNASLLQELIITSSAIFSDQKNLVKLKEFSQYASDQLQYTTKSELFYIVNIIHGMLDEKLSLDNIEQIFKHYFAQISKEYLKLALVVAKLINYNKSEELQALLDLAIAIEIYHADLEMLNNQAASMEIRYEKLKLSIENESDHEKKLKLMEDLRSSSLESIILLNNISSLSNKIVESKNILEKKFEDMVQKIKSLESQQDDLTHTGNSRDEGLASEDDDLSIAEETLDKAGKEIASNKVELLTGIAQNLTEILSDKTKVELLKKILESAIHSSGAMVVAENGADNYALQLLSKVANAKNPIETLNKMTKSFDFASIPKNMLLNISTVLKALSSSSSSLSLDPADKQVVDLLKISNAPEQGDGVDNVKVVLQSSIEEQYSQVGGANNSAGKTATAHEEISSAKEKVKATSEELESKQAEVLSIEANIKLLGLSIEGLEAKNQGLSGKNNKKARHENNKKKEEIKKHLEALKGQYKLIASDLESLKEKAMSQDVEEQSGGAAESNTENTEAQHANVFSGALESVDPDAQNSQTGLVGGNTFEQSDNNI